MAENKTVLIKLYTMKPWGRELWSDFCTFSVLAGLFAVGWFFDSSAMEWFAFIAAFLILFSKANSSTKNFTPKEAVEYIQTEFLPPPTPATPTNTPQAAASGQEGA